MRTTRGTLIISLLVSLALLSLPVLAVQARHTEGGRTTSSGRLEEGAGTWQPWLLAAGSELRLPPPPGRAATRAEIAQLQALADQRDAAAHDRINYWDTGAPGYRWNELALQQLLGNRLGANRAGRALALLNVAISDATIAAWDTKYAYRRARPSESRPSLPTALPTPASPAYPSEHAVTAGAASTVLAYLFPAEAASFAARAEEAGRSRLLAGTDYPSDVAAGLALGRAVGARVVAWAETDQADAKWTGRVPEEEGMWTGTNPIEPLAGTWKSWVLTSSSQVRPGLRAAHDSEQMARELAEVKNFPRTNATNVTASFWEYYAGLRGHLYWNNQTSHKLVEYRLDVNPPRAARVYALQSIAFHDSLVACWDAKYAYWAPRPVQLDPTLTTVFTTPNHPSYPAAHACVGGAMATVLGHLFPRETATFTALVEEAAWSRLAAGVHFRSDIEVGLVLGQAVGQIVIERARADGAE